VAFSLPVLAWLLSPLPDPSGSAPHESALSGEFLYENHFR
jgi:hypothetical protein